MKKILQLIAAAFIVFSMSNCATSTNGPSCTWLFIQCSDYSNASASETDAGKTLCQSTFGSWATTGCTYSNCGNPDPITGVITCKP